MGWARHRRVLGELEPTVRLHVAYGDISVVRLGDAVAERLERLDGLLDPLLEHGTRIDPRPEVPAPKARRGAQHVMDFGDGLDVGVDVERRRGVLVAEDRLVLLLVSMVPAVVVSVIKNGAGGSEYPVALIRAGASTTSMVGEAVLCSIPLLVMAYGVISVVAALTAAISRNPVVTGMVCAVLLVLGSLSAHVESVGMGVALLAPFASFDPASQVGTIGFLGRGTNAMPFGEVVGASGALLVVLGAVSPLMVRLSVPKIERG